MAITRNVYIIDLQGYISTKKEFTPYLLLGTTFDNDVWINCICCNRPHGTT
jgi:hypothetical protein